MDSSPSTDPRHLAQALKELQDNFKLSNEQLAALPALDDVDLVPQNDSHFIQTEDVGLRTAHPFKLYIGESNGSPFYVYLFEQGRRRQMKIEIDSVDEDGGSFWPVDPQYFGTVQNLAYPFNEWLGASRFLAAVKFYFLLGYRLGLYDKDPGFSVTKSWRNDLQGACNDLIKANEEIAREERVKKDKASGKQRAPSTQPPSPSLDQDMRPQARQSPTDRESRNDMGNEEEDEHQRRGRLAPHHSPHRQGFPPPFHSPPPPPGYYPPQPYFGTPPPGYYPPPPGYAGTPPPNFRYPPGPYPPPLHPAGSQYSPPGPHAGDEEDRLSPSYDELQLPKPRKKGHRQSTVARSKTPAPVKAGKRPEAPSHKLKAQSRSLSIHSECELDETAL